jgi:hypothetical protein
MSSSFSVLCFGGITRSIMPTMLKPENSPNLVPTSMEGGGGSLNPARSGFAGEASSFG